MISGCGLIEEDFRLKRAAEAMKPLEAASPVFAKIGQLLSVLLSEDCKDRAGALMDAITLVDAVLCTQGAVNVPGELEEIETNSWGSAVTNAPYSVLHTLLDALTTSGGGRYGFVMETHEAHPELFEDYRVKHVLVQALGASHAELAEQVAQWLKESGPSILPLLYKEFDPKGKKEMVRRVQVIEAIAKAGANEFYLKMLPEAEKDVRGALIYALRHDNGNAPLLMDLAKAEKGNNKKMAHWALAFMDTDETAGFWNAYMKKKPGEAVYYLAESNTEWASRLTAGNLQELLRPWVHYSGSAETRMELTKESAGLLFAHLRALPKKTGPEVLECFRMAAVAKMLYAAPEEFAEWIDRRVHKKVLLGKSLDRNVIEELCLVFDNVYWDEKVRSYVLKISPYSEADEQRHEYCRRLSKPFDRYFTDLFIECRHPKLDSYLERWIQPDNREYCEKLKNYFYNRARTTQDNRIYLAPLRKLGLTDSSGLAMKYFKGKSQVYGWDAWDYLHSLPGTWESKLKEAEGLYELVNKKEIKGLNLKERLEEFIDFARTRAISETAK